MQTRDVATQPDSPQPTARHIDRGVWTVFGIIAVVGVLALLVVTYGLPFRLPRDQGPAIATPTPDAAGQSSNPVGTPLPGNLDQVVFTEDGKTYTIRQLLQRDGIRPIYKPEFSANPDAYADDELVMGVEIKGDARAYSVSFLNRREMVNDVVGGTPVLVTW